LANELSFVVGCADDGIDSVFRFLRKASMEGIGNGAERGMRDGGERRAFVEAPSLPTPPALAPIGRDIIPRLSTLLKRRQANQVAPMLRPLLGICAMMQRTQCSGGKAASQQPHHFP
jgi:hypothetical protein